MDQSVNSGSDSEKDLRDLVSSPDGSVSPLDILLAKQSYFRKWSIYKAGKVFSSNSYDGYAESPQDFQNFFSIICQNVLQLEIGKEAFYDEVDERYDTLGMAPHRSSDMSVEIDVAIDMLLEKHEQNVDQALLAVISVPCPQDKEIVLVNKLLQKGANARVKDKVTRRSALHHAVKKGHCLVVEKLLEHGAYPIQRDREGVTPICMALMDRNDALAAVLLHYITPPFLRKLFGRPKVKHCSLYALIETGKMKRTVMTILDALLEQDDSYGDTGAVAYYSLLEQDEDVVLPDNEEKFDNSKPSCLHMIAKSGDQDLITHPVVSCLLARKWKCFAQKAIILSGAVYLAVLILLTTSVILSVSKEDPSVYDASLTSDVIRAFCEVVVIIACLYTLAHETVDIFRFRLGYFTDPYNYFDVGYSSLLVAVVPLRFSGSHAQWLVFSIGYTLAIMRMVKYASVIRRLRTYTRIMYTLIVKEFREFTVIIILTTLAFAGSFMLSLRYGDKSEVLHNQQTSSFAGILLTGVRIVIEDSAVLNYYNKDGHVHGWFCTVIIIVYMFVVMVMLLNILIAQLTDIYESIRRGAQVEVEIHRAAIIASVEMNTFSFQILYKKSLRQRFYKEKDNVDSEDLVPYQRLKPCCPKTKKHDSSDHMADLEMTLKSIKHCLNSHRETWERLSAFLSQHQLPGEEADEHTSRNPIVSFI